MKKIKKQYKVSLLIVFALILIVSGFSINKFTSKTISKKRVVNNSASYTPSTNFLANDYSCPSGNQFEFPHGIFDKQWVNVVVKINNVITSGVNVTGHNADLETSTIKNGNICTGTGSSTGSLDKSTGTWFRYMDSSAKFYAEITYKIPETGKAYTVNMSKNNPTNSVDNMTVNSISSSTGVFCYKYGNTSNTETGTSCAKWDSNTTYVPKDASIGDFTYVVGNDTSSNAPVHELVVDIKPKFNVTYLDYNDTVLQNTTAYDYKTPLSSISKPSAPTRPSDTEYNYTFSNWIPNVSYDSNLLVDDIVYTAAYTATKRSYSITFKDYDGTIISGPTMYEYGTSAKDITPNPPSREGYSFVGWDSSVKDVSGEATYTAVYKKSYKVTFDDGIGNQVGSTQDVVEGGSAIAPSTPTREGYDFKEWDKSVDNITEDIVIKATWTPTNYTITYNYNGGSATNPVNFTIESDTITLVNPTREGYQFKGWTGTNIQTPVMKLTIEKGSISNRVYEANWEAKQYTVSLTKEEGIDTIIGANTYDFEEKVTISATLKEGYEFDGWYNGNNKTSSDINYTFNMVANNVTYTAKAKLKTYKVEYLEYNEKTPSNKELSIKHGDTVKTIIDGKETIYTITDNTEIPNPAKEGYTFKGWTLTEEKILTAQYDVNSYTINVNSKKDNVDSSNEPYTVKYNETKEITFTPDPSYVIETVTIDGKPVTVNNNKYTFKNINSDHSVIVNYTKDSNNNKIPDKYEIKVTFKVVNGIFKKTSTSDDIINSYATHEYVEGIWNKKDEIKLTNIPVIKPNEDYKEGSWDVNIDKNTLVTTDITYTYTCLRDYKFTKQPDSKESQTNNTFDINWSLNFIPERIEKYSAIDNTLIDELKDPSKSNLTIFLNDNKEEKYFLRAYYGPGEEDYVDSDIFTVKYNKLNNPQTGDNIKLYVGILVISTLILIIGLIFFLKNKKSKD